MQDDDSQVLTGELHFSLLFMETDHHSSKQLFAYHVLPPACSLYVMRAKGQHVCKSWTGSCMLYNPAHLREQLLMLILRRQEGVTQ